MTWHLEGLCFECLSWWCHLGSWVTLSSLLMYSHEILLDTLQVQFDFLRWWYQTWKVHWELWVFLSTVLSMRVSFLSTFYEPTLEMMIHSFRRLLHLFFSLSSQSHFLSRNFCSQPFICSSRMITYSGPSSFISVVYFCRWYSFHSLAMLPFVHKKQIVEQRSERTVLLSSLSSDEENCSYSWSLCYCHFSSFLIIITVISSFFVLQFIGNVLLQTLTEIELFSFPFICFPRGFSIPKFISSRKRFYDSPTMSHFFQQQLERRVDVSKWRNEITVFTTAVLQLLCQNS